MSLDKEALEKAKWWDKHIKRTISSNKNWRIPAPTITEHFNRIYGDEKTTIWLSWENQTFEIGVYFFAGAIEFSVQENAPDKKQFWSETYTPVGEHYNAWISKSIRKNIEYIYQAIHIPAIKPKTEIEEYVMNSVYDLKVDCPECRNMEDDQYHCTTCGSSGGYGTINIFDFLKERPHLLKS